MTFAVSLYSGCEDARPRQKNLTLQELRTLLEIWRVREEKDGPLWSPASFDLVKYRVNDNVSALSCIVLDFDEGHAWEDFQDEWQRWTYLIHTSWGHTPEHPKWRAVFPLAAPVLAEDWANIYASVSIGLSTGVTDPSCKDKSRMYYLATHVPDAEHYLSWHDGELLDINAFDRIDITEEDYEPPEPAQPSSTGKPGDDFDDKATWESILEPAGWTMVRKWFGGHMTLWRRPGKRKGVSARTGHGRYGDRFYCWSSSAPPIKPETLYKKYMLRAVVEFGGHDDECVKACIKQLAKEGYGDQSTAKKVKQKPPAEPENIITRAYVNEEPEPEGEYYDPIEKRWREFSIGDVGNAERFIAWFGKDVRYVAGRGWHVWDGGRWKVDEEGAVAVKWMGQRAGYRAMESAFAIEAGKERDRMLSIAGKLMQSKNLGNMLSLAYAFPQIEARLDDFDQDPYLLGVTNGTLDLRTGVLRPPNPADMITMRAGCSYEEAPCPQFLQFFEWAMNGREELMRFMMLSLGYSLSASDHTHAFWFCSGVGGNGKSVLMNIVYRLLGSYAGALSPESIMVRRNEQIPADIASIHGKRFVIVDEVESNRYLNAGLMKALSAFAPIQARFLNQNFFTFRPRAKIWLTGNEQPKIRSFDHGMRRRMNVVPFTNQISDEEKDDYLHDKLWKEAPGILWLLVQAFQEYDKHGLPVSENVTAATNAYQHSEDYVLAFIEDECDHCESSIRLHKKRVRERYLAWCKTNDASPDGRTTFFARMEAHGFKEAKTQLNGRPCFEGIRFKEELDL